MTTPIVPQLAETHEPQFDPSLRQYVGITLDGGEVYGDSWSECFQKLHGANGAILKSARNGEEAVPCSA